MTIDLVQLQQHMKNKYDFMRKILRDKRLTADMRERVFGLMGGEGRSTDSLQHEIKKDDNSDEKALNEESVKVQSDSNLKISKGEDDKSQHTKKSKDWRKVKRHSPKKVRSWLYEFTLNNSALKYSVHRWDEQDLYTSFNEFTKQLNDHFIKKDFYSMPKYAYNLYWKIYPFVFQAKATEMNKKKGFAWGRHRIKVGWQYPGSVGELYEGNNSSFFTPQDVQLPEELLPDDQINGKTIQTFGDVITIFKDEIEFRDDTLHLEVKLLAENVFGDDIHESLDLKSLKGCSFYTNTEYVLKAIERIFRMIKSRQTSNDIRVIARLDQNRSSYHISIEHRNSYSYKEIDHPKITLINDSGDMHVLRATLMSLCDFSIISKFKDNDQVVDREIKYLYDGVEENDWKPYMAEPAIDVTGFTFLLKFPR